MNTLINKGRSMISLLIVRNLSFFTLSLISLALSVYLFIQFSTQPIERMLFASLALAMEGSKIFALVEGMKEWKAKKKGSGSIKIFVYLLLALLSVIASYGFSLGALVRSNLDVSTSTYTIQKQALEKQIEGLDVQINNLMSQQTKLPEGWVTAAQRLQNSISELSVQRMDAYIQLTSLQPPTYDLATNAFSLIGESVGLTGKQVMFYLLILLSILIEVCMVFTAPGTYIERDVVKEEGENKIPEGWYQVMMPPITKKVDVKVHTKNKSKAKPPAAGSKKSNTKITKKGGKESIYPPPTPKPIPQPGEMVREDAPPPTTPKYIEPKEQIIPVRKSQSGLAEVFAIFVRALFDNGTLAHIKGMEEGSEDRKSVLDAFLKQVAIIKGQKETSSELSDDYINTYTSIADKFWKWLCNTEGPTGYVFVEKRNGFYFPNYTAELIINHFNKTKREAIYG